MNWYIQITAPRSTKSKENTQVFDFTIEAIDEDSKEKDMKALKKVIYTMNTQCLVDVAAVDVYPPKVKVFLIFYLLLTIQHSMEVGASKMMIFHVNVTNKDSANCSSSIFGLAVNAVTLPSCMIPHIALNT